MKKLIIITFITTIIASPFMSCSTKEIKEEKTNNYVIDTIVSVANSKIKLTVERKDDVSKRIITNNQLDWVDNGLFDSDAGYYSYNSNEYFVFFEDEHGKNKASINIDLLSRLSKSSEISSQIGTLSEEIISEESDFGIKFLGITPKGLLMFEVHTSYPRGEGGGTWTIGVFNKKNDWQKEYKEKNITHAPCLLMAYDNPMGDDIHYKIEKLFK